MGVKSCLIVILSGCICLAPEGAPAQERRRTSTAEGNPASHKGHQIVVFSLCVRKTYYINPWYLEVAAQTTCAPLNVERFALFQCSKAQLWFLLGEWTLQCMLCYFHRVFYHTCVLLRGAHHTTVCYCGVVSHGLHAVSPLCFL